MKKLIVISILTALYIQTTLAQVNFQNLDWNAALKKAAKEKKYIMTDCYTDWCYWCKVMDKQTFTDTEVGKFANEHFVSIKIDMEKSFGLDLGKKYHVSGFPTYLFFTPKGELIYTVTGFQPPADFLTSLKNAANPSTQTHLKGYSNTIKLTYPDFYGRETEPTEEELNTYLDKQTDLFTEVNWAVVSRYSGISKKYSQFFLDNHAKYGELFGKNAVKDILYGKFEKDLDSAIVKKDEILLKQYLDECNKYGLSSGADAEQNTRLYFYQATGDYKKLMAALQEWVKLTGNDTAMMLNNYCWGFYTGCDDPQLIHEAALMMEKVAAAKEKVAAVDLYYPMDTYAALLFKDKQYEKAEEKANKAIEAGKKQQIDYKLTERLLGYIKAAKSSDLVYGKRGDCDYAVVLSDRFFPVCPFADTFKIYDASYTLKDTVSYHNGLHYDYFWYKSNLKALSSTAVNLFSVRNIKTFGSLEGKLVINFSSPISPYEAIISDGKIPDDAAQRILQLGKDDSITFKNFYVNDGATVIPTEIKITVIE